jgi:ABC-type nitrate/sulfonate/bicarbonate transport system permease component
MPPIRPSTSHPTPRSRVSARDCKQLVVSIYEFVFGFGLSSVGGFFLGFWLGLKVLW